jgi:hypothetical protein
MGNLWDSYIQSLGKDTPTRKITPETVRVPTQDINPAVRGLITEGGEPDMVPARTQTSVENWHNAIYKPWFDSLSETDQVQARKGKLPFPGKNIMGECASCPKTRNEITGDFENNVIKPLEFVNGDGAPICRDCYTKARGSATQRTCPRCHANPVSNTSLNDSRDLCRGCYDDTNAVLPAELSKPDFIRFSVKNLIDKLGGNE